jgi:predicted dehydrogenase
MLRGGIIGFGRMGLTHFSILNNHPEVEFVGVCDSSSFMLTNVSKQMGIETFSDYRKMLDKLPLDFVIIATPTAAHAPTTKDVIEKGIHVFVEKPFSLNPDEGKDVIAAMSGKKIINQVGYVVRFNEVFVKVKELLGSGIIGSIINYKMEMYGPTVLKPTKRGWRSKKTEGGGCLYDFASHSIDLINYLLGEPSLVTGTVLKSIFSHNVEDSIISTLIHDDNISGNLLVNWSDASYRKPAYRFEGWGTKGKIIADLHSYKLYLAYDPGSGDYTQGWNNCFITDFAKPVRFYVRGNEFTNQLDYFVDSMLGKEPGNMCSFEDGLAADRIIDMLIKDASRRN